MTETTAAPRHLLKRGLRVALPALVLLLGLGVGYGILQTEPAPRRKATGPSVVDVQALTLKATAYQVTLRSQGTVTSPTRTALVSRVAGTVQEAAIEPGAFVSSGSVLVHLDEQDLDLALRELTQQGAQVEASLQEVASEQAATVALTALARERVEIESSELERILGLAKQGVAADTEIAAAKRNHVTARTTLATQETRLETLRSRRRVLREEIALIETRLAMARVNLSRARVLAPFAARVLSREVSAGQYVNAGTTLAVIHGLDRVELRLPLSSAQQRYLDLGHGHGARAADEGPSVKIRSRAGGATWVGRVLRSEALVDPESRQLFAVAEVLNPYGSPSEPSRQPLRVGEFVSAEIAGRLLQDVFVIPRASSPLPGEVLVIGSDDFLRRQSVEVLWSDADSLVVSGLTEGERLCTTPVVFAGKSLKVRVHQEGASK